MTDIRAAAERIANNTHHGQFDADLIANDAAIVARAYLALLADKTDEERAREIVHRAGMPLTKFEYPIEVGLKEARGLKKAITAALAAVREECAGLADTYAVETEDEDAAAVAMTIADAIREGRKHG